TSPTGTSGATAGPRRSAKRITDTPSSVTTKAALPSAVKVTSLGRKPTVRPIDWSLSPRVMTETSWKLPGGAPPVRAGLSYQATTCLPSGATASALTPGTTGTLEVRVAP